MGLEIEEVVDENTGEIEYDGFFCSTTNSNILNKSPIT